MRIPTGTFRLFGLTSGIALLVAAIEADAGPKLPEELASAATRTRIADAYGKQPLAFEENRGQTDSQVKFLTRGEGYGLFLTSTEAVIALRGQGPSPVLRMRWFGGNSSPSISGQGELPGQSHYLIGRDRAGWRTGIPSYARVLYRDVYPGIDLVFYGRERQLEHDFRLAPGADPAAIRLEFLGAERVAIDPAGDLVVAVGGAEIRLKRPVSFQEIGPGRREVASSWRLLPAGQAGSPRAGFEVGSYDRLQPLVIDPVLVYSTYLGGNSYDTADDVAVDAAGNAYITGWTLSRDFPLADPLKPALESQDAFVTKIAPSGSLVYSTYFGGSSNDEADGIAVDAAGSAYVTGRTSAIDFPLVNPLPPEYRGSPSSEEVFVAKLAPDGATLVYSTTLGGSSAEVGREIALDAAGHALVAGGTLSPDFPRVNGLPYGPRGGLHWDVFVARLTPAGSGLVYATYISGGEDDIALGLDADAAGHAYITGYTSSPDFPTTAGALQPALQGSHDAFVAKLAPGGSALVYSTYLGGSSFEEGWSIAVDAAGRAYVTGYTFSPDFPLAQPLQATLRGGYDLFVTRLGASGTLERSTLLGGSNSELSWGIDVGATGDVYVTGITHSTDFPLVDPVQAECEPRDGPAQCSGEVFVARLRFDPPGLVYSTYFGGVAEGPFGSRPVEFGRAIAVGPGGDAYVVGDTYSADFPTVNALQPAFGGGDLDGFALRLTLNRSPDCAAAAAAPSEIWPPNGRLVAVGIRGVADPDGDPVTVLVTGIAQDEPLTAATDASGLGTAAARVRASRSGRGDGRVYHLTFEAQDGRGGTCTGTVQICVPHDRRPGAACGDGGPLFGSAGG